MHCRAVLGDPMATERLQKVLAHWGVASRRHAETLIRQGDIWVNGHPAQVGDKVDPDRDRIEYHGQPLRPAEAVERVYLLLHKPKGVISTCQDPRGRCTVLDVLPRPYRAVPGLHPVGRLDADSSGALIVTNDGELTYLLTHPRHSIPKTYRVWVQGQPSEPTLARWRHGVPLDGRLTLPATIRPITTTGDRTLLDIVLREGRNRQIRRVAEALGHPVISLKRVAIGAVHLGGLRPQQVRPLSRYELDALRKAGGCRSRV